MAALDLAQRKADFEAELPRLTEATGDFDMHEVASYDTPVYLSFSDGHWDTNNPDVYGTFQKCKVEYVILHNLILNRDEACAALGDDAIAEFEIRYDEITLENAA